MLRVIRRAGGLEVSGLCPVLLRWVIRRAGGLEEKGEKKCLTLQVIRRAGGLEALAQGTRELLGSYPPRRRLRRIYFLRPAPSRRYPPRRRLRSTTPP
ncbi:hypothetical protein DWUX_101 [Desulfovibrio diazotrophicus]|nr:hypothetical protein DWUX_101 [Desulfovibrio diazotrophicus]